jgi:hypothetical protein
MAVRKVEYPYIEGITALSWATTVRVDLRKVNRVEVCDNDPGKAMRSTLGVVLVAAALLLFGYVYYVSKWD